MHDNNETIASRAAGSRVIYHWRKPRSVLVGALHDGGERQPDDPLIPWLDLRGMWMTAAGIDAGARLGVETAPGCILLRSFAPVVRVAYRPGWYRWTSGRCSSRR